MQITISNLGIFVARLSHFTFFGGDLMPNFATRMPLMVHYAILPFLYFATGYLGLCV